LILLKIERCPMEENYNSNNSLTFKVRKNILLVDDSEDNRFLIHIYLKKHNIEIDDAENGQIAFNKFKTGNYDLVIMDIQMPVMCGFTSTKLIRAYEKEQNTNPVPILALTAYSFEDAFDKALEVGFTNYLRKPIKKKKLIEIIDNLLKE